MNNKILVASLSCGIATVVAHADWTVVSTFDDKTGVTDVTNIEGSNARTEVENGRLVQYPGDLFELNSNVYTMIDLGTDLRAASIAVDGPVTAYIEVIHPSVNSQRAIVDIVWGLSNATPDSVLAGDPNRYNAYNVMQRINSGTLGYEVLNKVDGSNAYQPIDFLELDVVYSIWMVVDYTLNYWECYIQGGQWPTQTRLNTLDESGIWLFRTDPAPEGEVRYIQISTSRGNTVQGEKGIDPFKFDNVAIDTTGANLTMPPIEGAATWAGYPVSPEGWVDTGAWLGMIYVNNPPFVYSMSLGTYIYLPEDHVDNSGAWSYIYK